MTTWSIITVTFNSKAALEKSGAAVLDLPDDVEHIIVDNYSTDGTTEYLRQCSSRRIIQLDKNRGFSFANNVGFDESAGQYIAFVNPDVTFDPSTLIRLAKVLSQLGNNALIAPQLTQDDGELQPNGRGLPYLTSKIASRLGISPKSAAQYHRFAPRGVVQPVDWVIGAAVCGHRDLLKTLGPWDSSFFIYYEDSDLCLRAKRAGAGTYVVGDVLWPHAWARETSGFNWRAWRREITSAWHFYSRYVQLIAPIGRLMKANASSALQAPNANAALITLDSRSSPYDPRRRFDDAFSEMIEATVPQHAGREAL